MLFYIWDDDYVDNNNGMKVMLAHSFFSFLIFLKGKIDFSNAHPVTLIPMELSIVSLTFLFFSYNNDDAQNIFFLKWTDFR